jgi:hypothetical protein
VGTQGLALAKQMLYLLSHNSSPVCSGYFADGVSRTICPGWPLTSILLISAFCVARITDMSTGAQINFLKEREPQRMFKNSQAGKFLCWAGLFFRPPEDLAKFQIRAVFVFVYLFFHQR